MAAAQIVGSSPEETIRRLQAIRLQDGDTLRVGPYLADRHVIEASLWDAGRGFFGSESVNIVVLYDSVSGRAQSIDIRRSVDRPL